MSDIDAVLAPFCDPFGRVLCQAPFVYRGWRYATDGRVIVRIPWPGEPDTDFGEKLSPLLGRDARPHIESLFAPPDGRTRRVRDGNGSTINPGRPACTEPWPEWDGESYEADCEWCGDGKVPVECPDCDGAGEFDAGDECERCWGSGEIAGTETCPHCKGTNTVPDRRCNQRVAGLLIGGEYHRQIEALAETFGPVTCAAQGELLAFAARELEGVLCTISEPAGVE